jgi:hypothetical protein
MGPTFTSIDQRKLYQQVRGRDTALATRLDSDLNAHAKAKGVLSVASDWVFAVVTDTRVRVLCENRVLRSVLHQWKRRFILPSVGPN